MHHQFGTYLWNYFQPSKTGKLTKSCPFSMAYTSKVQHSPLEWMVTRLLSFLGSLTFDERTVKPLVFRNSPNTPPKINMAPKNEGLEDDFTFQTGDFQVPC